MPGIVTAVVGVMPLLVMPMLGRAPGLVVTRKLVARPIRAPVGRPPIARVIIRIISARLRTISIRIRRWIELVDMMISRIINVMLDHPLVAAIGRW